MIDLIFSDGLHSSWSLECDSCGYQTTYKTSEEIKDWKFVQSIYGNKESHFCIVCHD